MLVIGAQGALGRICAEALVTAGLDVIRAGRRPENSAGFRLIDLDDSHSVSEGCAGVDLVVSTVRHREHAAERTVAREGGALLNVASLCQPLIRLYYARSGGAKRRWSRPSRREPTAPK